VTYQVRLKRSALKTINSLDARTQRRLWARIRSLADNPRPPGAKALQEPWKGHYRLRVGDYRLLYTIEDDRLLVLVVKVGQRETVYRK
jgi:mRNA interferase RelE/StbE